jgi:hypothetical protein
VREEKAGGKWLVTSREASFDEAAMILIGRIFFNRILEVRLGNSGPGIRQQITFIKPANK